MIKKIWHIYKQDGLAEFSQRGFRSTLLCTGKTFLRTAAPFSKDLEKDLKSFVRDFKDTQDVQNLIENLRRDRKVHSIEDIDISRFKRSETIFILGSGASINDLTTEDWTHISQHDSVGFNFWLVHDFVPTYYFFEPSLHDDRHETFLALLEEKQKAYSCVPFVCEYKYWYQTRKTFEDFPNEIRKNLYLYAPYYIRVISPRLVALSLVLWRLTGSYRLFNFHRIIHHRATLSALIMFSILSGYKKIVMIGIDLNNSQYFWEDASQKYFDRTKPRNIETSNVHSTVDTNVTRSEWAIPIDQYLDFLDRIVLRPTKMELYVGTIKSKLYPRFPLYSSFQKG